MLLLMSTFSLHLPNFLKCPVGRLPSFQNTNQISISYVFGSWGAQLADMVSRVIISGLYPATELLCEGYPYNYLKYISRTSTFRIKVFRHLYRPLPEGILQLHFSQLLLFGLKCILNTFEISIYKKTFSI